MAFAVIGDAGRSSILASQLRTGSTDSKLVLSSRLTVNPSKRCYTFFCACRFPVCIDEDDGGHMAKKAKKAKKTVAKKAKKAAKKKK